MLNKQVVNQFKLISKSNKIVNVLEKWLKVRNIKTTDYQKATYKRMAYDILEVLNQ